MVRGRRVLLAGVLALCLSIAVVTAVAAQEEEKTDEQKLAEQCVGSASGVILETVDYATVDGTIIRACLAYPEAGAVDTLVTFTHGINNYVQQAWVDHVLRTAAQGVAAVATNYRDNFGFPALRGAEDTITLTQLMLDRFPTVTRSILFSVSMGGSVGGTAIVEAPRLNDGEGLWQHWFAIEGVSDAFETYAEAAAAEVVVPVAGRAREGLERDAGGTPVEVPDAYARRSPVLHAQTMAANGLLSAAVVHAVNDGLVGYHQGASMAAALCSALVPTSFDTIVTGSGSSDDSTLFDLVPVGLEEVNQETLDLSGHAWEGDPDHPVMVQALQRLSDLIAGVPLDGGCAQAIAAEENTQPVAGPDAGDVTDPSVSPEGDSQDQAPIDDVFMPRTGGASLVTLFGLLSLLGASVWRRRLARD